MRYLQSYAKTKGENFATKEDIGKITKEVESVNDEYRQSIEKFKYELKK